MTSETQTLEATALKLSPRARARLAEQLIASLDIMDTAASERLWAEEAERRYQAYQAGKIPARAAEDVFKDAYGKLKGNPFVFCCQPNGSFWMGPHITKLKRPA